MSQMHTTLGFEIARFSQMGGRNYNEDVVDDCSAFSAVHMLMVADGAGGQGGGAIAARTAADAAKAEFLRLPAFAPDTLRRCLHSAEKAVVQRQQEDRSLARMASTFVAVLISYQRAEALLCNLGDSRAYLFRDSQILAQSYDHSLVQRFIDAGMYPREKLRQHPKRNVLYASLGANEEGVQPYVTEAPIPLQAGDSLMLCSDGVWELLDDQVLVELCSNSASVADWQQGLQQRVQAAGDRDQDNYSAILVRCHAGDPAQRLDDEPTTQPLVLG